jgi:ubiquinone/menaquinone biosynthesis C-methylase UbiE
MSLVYSFYQGGVKPQFVRIALLLDVFSPLAGGPADAQSVASACGCEVEGMRFMLDYLCGLRLVKRQGDAYALTPTASTFLVPGVVTYAGDWLLMQTGPAMWEGILQAIRSGRRSYPEVPWPQDAWLESYSSARVDASLEMWRAAGIEPGEASERYVLDLACGCAIKSLALAQADPLVSVTCVDSADVLDVAREVAARLGVLSQAAFLPGDMHTMSLGRGQYDAALLGQITYFFQADHNRELFRRVYRALAPGGVLVLDTFIAPEEPDEVSSQFSLLLWALSGGAAYSFTSYRTWLEEAGFSGVQQLGPKWLSAAKV